MKRRTQRNSQARGMVQSGALAPTPTTPYNATPAGSATVATQQNGDVRPLYSIIQPRVRDRWLGLMRRNYTPELVRATLDGSNSQRIIMLFSMFEMMEDTWPRLAKNMHELKSAVCELDFPVLPFSEEGQEPTATAVQKQKFVQECFKFMKGNPVLLQNSLRGTMFDILDAYGKGLSVLEIDWARRNDGAFLPLGTRWLRPVYFDYPYLHDEIDRLMLCPDGRSRQYIDFPTNKFLIGVYRSRSGYLPTETAILRSLAPWWVFGNFSTEWLVNFAQLFGMPIRWAKYDPNRPDQLVKIAEMLDNMGSAGWGAFPIGTELELHEAAKSGTDNPQTAVLDRADMLCDLAILGQTLTGNATKQGSGSRSLGEVHERVKKDRLRDAAAFVASVFNDQFIPAILELNFGNRDEAPCVHPDIEEVVDEVQMATRDKTLFVDMKVPVPLKYIRDRHKLPAPKPGDELYEAPEPPAPIGPGAGGAKQKVKASAFLGDIRLGDLPPEVLKDVARFSTAKPDALLPHYGMVVPELLHKADPHNLATARAKVAKTKKQDAREKHFAKADTKMILVSHDRIVDGHHFLANAERAGVTSSLKVLDLTPAKYSVQARLPGEVRSALMALPVAARDAYLEQLEQAE